MIATDEAKGLLDLAVVPDPVVPDPVVPDPGVPCVVLKLPATAPAELKSLLWQIRHFERQKGFAQMALQKAQAAWLAGEEHGVMAFRESARYWGTSARESWATLCDCLRIKYAGGAQ